MNQVPIASKCV